MVDDIYTATRMLLARKDLHTVTVFFSHGTKRVRVTRRIGDRQICLVTSIGNPNYIEREYKKSCRRKGVSFGILLIRMPKVRDAKGKNLA